LFKKEVCRFRRFWQFSRIRSAESRPRSSNSSGRRRRRSLTCASESRGKRLLLSREPFLTAFTNARNRRVVRKMTFEGIEPKSELFLCSSSVTTHCFCLRNLHFLRFSFSALRSKMFQVSQNFLLCHPPFHSSSLSRLIELLDSSLCIYLTSRPFHDHTLLYPFPEFSNSTSFTNVPQARTTNLVRCAGSV